MDRDSERRADEAAARWLTRLNARSITTEELDQFYGWRREPANAAAYARAEAAWRGARNLAADPEIAAAIDEALERPRSRSLWAGVTRRRLLLTGLAAAPVAAVAATAWWALASHGVHETQKGERLAFALADGTRVELNSDSQVEIAFSETERRVELRRGEAVFSVKRDAARPFIVSADGRSVRALGTSFAMRRANRALRVVLIEGKVELRAPDARPATLARAGAAAIMQPGAQIALGSADAEAETAWTRGKLLFRRTPLVSAVAQVNRYSDVTIELGNAGLGTHQVDGSFDIGDRDSFIAAVTTIFDLRARTVGNRIVLEPARNPA